MSLEAWDALYEELPSRQLKVKVSDRSVFKTTAADTKLTHPTTLQGQIDELVGRTAKGRAFVRPSGTEDVVRVYAEAETREQCDLLASKHRKFDQINAINAMGFIKNIRFTNQPIGFDQPRLKKENVQYYQESWRAPTFDFWAC